MKLQGRVFERWQQFTMLPKDIQDQTASICAYLTTHQAKLFNSHKTMLVKSVRAISGNELMVAIEQWFKQQQSTHPGLHHVKDLAEAVVLCGFLTPEGEKKSTDQKARLVFEDELLIPVAREVTEHKSTSVWQVFDGAVFAGWMKWKHGLSGLVSDGKDVYVVVNEKMKSLTLFESDLALGPLAEYALNAKLTVAMDTSQFECGVKFWTDETSEILNACSRETQSALVDAIARSGANGPTTTALPTTTSTTSPMMDTTRFVSGTGHSEKRNSLEDPMGQGHLGQNPLDKTGQDHLGKDRVGKDRVAQHPYGKNRDGKDLFDKDRPEPVLNQQQDPYAFDNLSDQDRATRAARV